MDWNNDGKKDVILGERNGTVRIYINNSTDADPKFSGFTYLKQAGVNVDVGLNSHPFIVDWDNDGYFDLLIGDDTGRVHYLHNNKGPFTPTFDPKVYLYDGASILTTGNEASPAVCDWDRDGKKDLIVGDYNGNIRVYINNNTDAAPLFNGFKKFRDETTAIIDVEYYARIDVYDWNNDGVVDILSGNRNYNAAPSGGVWFFESKGPLSGSDTLVSEAVGGSITMDITAGAANAGRNYMVFASATGSSPGTPFPGGYVVAPFNWDILTNLVITFANTPSFLNFMGQLDASGGKTATLTLPGGTGAMGLIMTFAAVCEGPWDYTTNPVHVEIGL